MIRFALIVIALCVFGPAMADACSAELVPDMVGGGLVDELEGELRGRCADRGGRLIETPEGDIACAEVGG